MSDGSSTADQAAGPAPEVAARETDAATETSSSESEVPAQSEVSVPSDRRSRAQIQTVRLDSRDFRASWPMAIAALEQLSGWAVLALRLGTLALIQQCVRELAEEDARAELVVRLRELADALAHMPLET